MRCPQGILEKIAFLADGEQIARVLRVRFDLPSQALDAGLDLVNGSTPLRGGSPHILEQLGGGNGVRVALRQAFKHVEL
jgi:hypothetical protein